MLGEKKNRNEKKTRREKGNYGRKNEEIMELITRKETKLGINDGETTDKEWGRNRKVRWKAER